ncbi:hypothetical protein [Olsenella massiliensis]|uniref:hypothetical protein n=1 Tax=Olsenella massiliensis TaxID=1622075 RepID=UPI00071C70CF|nr:hypothetical protein [Olsenella massiliensis]
MSGIETRAYADDDSIRIYYLKDGETVWASRYTSLEDATYVAQDFIGLATQCMDPIEEGWPGEQLDEAAELGTPITT